MGFVFACKSHVSQDGKQLEFLLSNNETLWLNVESSGKVWYRETQRTKTLRANAEIYMRTKRVYVVMHHLALFAFDGAADLAETVAQDDMSPEEDIWVFLLDLSRVPMEATACCHECTLK